MAWWVRDDTDVWRDVTAPKIQVNDKWYPVVRGMVYTGTKWERFFPHQEVTVTTITAGLTAPVNVGQARSVSGTVYTISGVVSGGTVTVQQRLAAAGTVPAGAWVTVGTSAALTTSASVPWSAAVTPTICGASEFRAVYSGSPVNQGSSSVPQAVTVVVGTPAKPTGVTLVNTTASISWPAVGGATSYDVWRKGVTAANPTGAKIKVSAAQAGVTFSDSALTPNTDYEWTVVAKYLTCTSPESPLKKGHTGQDAVNDVGSATIAVRPEKTNSYRNDVDWGYIGEAVGQGYYSVASRNYSGVIDYGTNAQLKAKVQTALGANGATRYTNMTVSAARVYLFKKTGVGAGGPVNVSFYVSVAEAGAVDAEPVRQGTKVTEATASGGSGKWQSIGTAHWALLKAGTARSVVTYDNAAANYAQFDGKSTATDRCNLQLDCAWNYALTAAVPPAWTP